MTLCICDVLGRLVRGCPVHAPGTQATPESTHVMLIRILQNQEKIMADLASLQAADAALKAEVTQAITDWQSQLAAANGDQAAIDAVTADMNSVVSQLQAADAANAGTGAGSGASNAGGAPSNPAPASGPVAPDQPAS